MQLKLTKILILYFFEFIQCCLWYHPRSRTAKPVSHKPQHIIHYYLIGAGQWPSPMCLYSVRQQSRCRTFWHLLLLMRLNPRTHTAKVRHDVIPTFASQGYYMYFITWTLGRLWTGPTPGDRVYIVYYWRYDLPTNLPKDLEWAYRSYITISIAEGNCVTEYVREKNRLPGKECNQYRVQTEYSRHSIHHMAATILTLQHNKYQV